MTKTTATAAAITAATKASYKYSAWVKPERKSIGGNIATIGDIETVSEMLSYKRPHGSKSEAEFIERYIMPHKPEVDDFGNFYLMVENPDGTAPATLWTSHTDSVHYEPGRQHVFNDNGMLKLSQPTRHSCLGADCAIGVWFMLEMYAHNVPGIYLFARDEEAGRTGSEWIAANDPAFLENFKHCVSFDRWGTKSIITHQMGVRCASEAFSKSLAAALSLDLVSDDGGSFTDSASFMGIIPECTNLAVGYYDQHTSRESQDIHFAAKLRNHLIAADFSGLVAERDPALFDDGGFDGFSLGFGRGSYVVTDEFEDMRDIVYYNPDDVAQWLLDEGYTPDDIQRAL